jgi:hypothetical protein
LGQLIRRVAQPFCVDVACHDEGLRTLPSLAVAEETGFGGMGVDPVDVPTYGCVERVGKGVAEDLGKISVFEGGVEVVYYFLDGWRREFAAGGVGPLRGEFERSFTEWFAGDVSI